jgi:protein TonB
MKHLVMCSLVVAVSVVGPGITEPIHAQRSPAAPQRPPGVFLESEVGKPAKPLAGNPSPRFPEHLRLAELKGEVRAEFVVDTTGIPDTTSFKVLESTHGLFTAAVKTVLPSLRFAPAERGGKKVKQLVQMPFKFDTP